MTDRFENCKKILDELSQMVFPAEETDKEEENQGE
jgi:hypothetical protein